MFGDDHLGESLRVLSFGVVVLVPVDEHDDVGVLLDGARFAKVSEPRTFVFPRFEGTVELRHGDDRDVQFSGQVLQRPADLGDLLLAVLAVRALHQLQVVFARMSVTVS